MGHPAYMPYIYTDRSPHARGNAHSATSLCPRHVPNEYDERITCVTVNMNERITLNMMSGLH